MKNKALISLIIFLSLLNSYAYSADSEKELQKALEQAATYYNEAIDLYKQDEVDKSIDLFEKAIKIKPDFYEAHYNLAQILMSVNKNDEAIESLKEIEKIHPNDSENLYNLGKTYYKKGLLSKSHEALKKITINSPEYDSAKILIDKIEKRQKELNLEQKINAHQNIVDSQGKAQAVTLGEFSAPSGTTLDSRGNIYVASFLENKIYKISIYGQKSPLPKSNLIQGPIGLATDKNDNIYVANYSANNIIKITPENNVSIFADVQKPYCLIYDENHNRLYVTEQSSNKLIKFDL